MVLKNKIINVYIARDGDSNIYYHILDPFVNKKSYIRFSLYLKKTMPILIKKIVQN
jgi:hypothetical protein